MFCSFCLSSCISSVSYIKPQLDNLLPIGDMVVYRPFPTSNHNPMLSHILRMPLYIVRFLHQTTTKLPTIKMLMRCISSVSYIKPQPGLSKDLSGFVVYRPFPTSNHNQVVVIVEIPLVVYRPFPTSNHNMLRLPKTITMLYIVRFLHQTTTRPSEICRKVTLYIVRFLHQTTTAMRSNRER